jgi:glycosyltransferase involved in cell wall biosynthesis
MPWSPDAIGGVSQVIINLHRTFTRSGPLQPRLLIEAYPHRTTISIQTGALGPADGFYLMPPTAPGRRLRGLAAFLGRLPTALIRLRRYLRDHAVKAINVHYPSLSAVTLLLARRIYDRHVPVVLSVHGADLNAPRAAGRFDRLVWAFVARHCDAIVACSQALEAEARSIFPAAADKIRTIHNGIDAAACRAAARTGNLPPELRGRRYLACIGTFERKKGQDVLLDAFSRIASGFPDLHLALVGGTAAELPVLRADAASWPDRIHFFPDRDHASALAILSGAQLMVHPARQEPFGLVILEAASLDVPVIACRVGGIPEIIEDGRSGRLVPRDDPGALAAAITVALGDMNTMRAYAASLRRDAETRFSWETAAKAYAGLFKTRSP